MPENPEDDAPRYDIPLDELTGRHGYARSRAAGEPDDPDDPIDPGAPVAYVAEEVRDRPNMLTIEGMIVGIGNAASAAAREGGEPKWVLRGLLVVFLLPVLVLVGYTMDLF
ncbi:MAG TPA: hypothetical protein VNA20_14645 [Frankiaceae bacterium]|nr:hypothetical protein [Frankiaceae bacterium]